MIISTTMFQHLQINTQNICEISKMPEVKKIVFLLLKKERKGKQTHREVSQKSGDVVTFFFLI